MRTSTIGAACLAACLVSLPLSAQWTKVPPSRIREVIQDWRPFLNEQRSQADQPVFRVYHTSFQDFLAEEGMGLKPFHNAIAQPALRKILSKIPGFLTGGD